MKRIFTIWVFSITILSMAQYAYACGESMFRVGFGVNVPPARALNSVSIVLFKTSDSAPDVFFDDSKISSKLVKAGHHVSEYNSGIDTGNLPQSIDVVIARAEDIEKARETLGSSFTHVSFLPVYEGKNSGSNNQAPVLSANATIRQILSTLQRVRSSSLINS